MKKILKVPYLSQNDNTLDPQSSCNVTSVAMVLQYLGARRREEYSKFKQFEDELHRCCADRGWNRRDPNHLSHLIRLYKCRDNFTTQCTPEVLRDWLDMGLPAITHGWFTGSGHIIVIVGYDDKGFYVHDPYGEWFKTGYRTDLTGKCLHYSESLIARTCYPDGEFWVHLVDAGNEKSAGDSL
ncbi:MAG: C39 family peptidase [Microcoleus vaginatus WJT46-NPBG5]|jgi:hypothetical protein|nr:C39 family peptidase [Microcoleus vaginatus WJT46-NPBG5]MBW4680241.1 C39 family peptidase [Microcoleus vaginatus WJT46-NPBG5]